MDSMTKLETLQLRTESFTAANRRLASLRLRGGKKAGSVLR
jgi:hypothetical protein